MRTCRVWIVAVLLIAAHPGVHGQDKAASEDWKVAKVSFDDAVKTVDAKSTDALYSGTGYFDSAGKIIAPAVQGVENNALGCSSYVAAVLACMKWGKDDWAKKQFEHHELEVGWTSDGAQNPVSKGKRDKDVKKKRLYQGSGKDIALVLRLGDAFVLEAAAVGDRDKIKALVGDGKGLTAKRWYMFNVETDPGKDWEGHVGFVKVNEDGSLEQRHYSASGGKGAKAGGGLLTGDFAVWHKNAKAYKQRNVELWLLPETKK